MIVFAIYKKRR